jgi:hypothetical protein
MLALWTEASFFASWAMANGHSEAPIVFGKILQIIASIILMKARTMQSEDAPSRERAAPSQIT